MRQYKHLNTFVKVYAEAVVHLVGNESLLDFSYTVTSENVSRFCTVGDRLQVAAQTLREAGFDVLDIGQFSIAIAASPEVYERAFQTTLEAVERPVIKERGRASTATFINAVDHKPFGEIDISHTAWVNLLDGVIINEPVYYYQDVHPYYQEVDPSSAPPITTEAYLSVPDGVAQGLNATLVHQQGITGKGVRVVMVDSGWYPHPFFAQHNYKVDVVLAPGSTDPWRDDNGHGTGESANVLAIAPDVSLTMVKADIALSGQAKNVNAIAAFRKAVALKPDIISCSWGSDRRAPGFSAYDRLLAATVADAVRQGIIVIFAAGNGGYGFPAQHPDVIAVGGVYLHLNGSLKGKLEASNYASSFISPMYPGRQVPDVCGLVGQLPSGDYILLPVPPGCAADQNRALGKDGTEPIDGWAAFSGTSAAAPQLAGICALMKQVYPDLSPAEAKRILQQTARDVVDGFSHPASGGSPARAGPDLATGNGLADAYAAVEVAQSLVNSICCDDCAASNSNVTFSESNTTVRTKQSMYSQFPKLYKKLDELLWKFEQELQDAIELYGLEDVELNISDTNFVSRSPVTKVAFYLRQMLDDCFEKGKIDRERITEEHVSAAQGLLKIGRYQETAINVLTEALLKTGTSAGIKNIKKLASEALSECGSEIASFDSVSKSVNSFFDRQEINLCKGGNLQCDVVDGVAHCGNAKYVKENGCWK